MRMGAGRKGRKPDERQNKNENRLCARERAKERQAGEGRFAGWRRLIGRQSAGGKEGRPGRAIWSLACWLISKAGCEIGRQAGRPAGRAP